MHGLNRFWVAVRALFKGEERAKENDVPKPSTKPDCLTRDLRPPRNAVGGASKGGLQGNPSKNSQREIDFMGEL